MIDVSIVVPVYNSEKYLERCLSSLFSQTYNNYEVVIINDGSTDNSLNIINKYKENNNIKIINTKNNGIGIARNIGLENAQGKYITFVDSDDYISKKYVEELLNCAEKNKADIVICDMYKYINRNEIKCPSISFNDGDITSNKEQIINIPLGPCGKLFKKHILTKGFAEHLKYEDVPFVINALTNSKRTVKLNEYLYYYVIHGNSETTLMDDRVFDILEILRISNGYLSEYKDLKNEIEYLNITLLSRYNLQQKYQKHKKLRNKFLNESFEFLNKFFPNWKNNYYFKKEPLLKRIIKSNKQLIKLYWL